MKRIYLNKATGLKALFAGLFLLGTLATEAQCTANFTYNVGTNGLVNVTSTSTGTTISTAYSWNFGTGTNGSGASSSHVYTSNGYKQICLSIVSNTAIQTPCTSMFCDSILITGLPTSSTTPCVANFNYVLGANGAVSFMSTSSGTSSTTNYSWDFGSGTGNGTGQSTTHTYSSNGPKLVCLTVLNPLSQCGVCDTIIINSVNSNTTSPCAPSVVYTLSKDSTQALTWNAYPFYPGNVTNATWSWGDGSSSNGLYPSHTYASAGTYSTCVTVSVSCGTVTATYCYVAAIFRSKESNDMITVNVKQNQATGINNHASASLAIGIYPNPNNGSFVLDMSGVDNAKEGHVAVYNMLGEKVFEKEVSSTTKQNLDMSHLSNGTYMLNINSEAGSVHKKMIIQK